MIVANLNKSGFAAQAQVGTRQCRVPTAS